MKRETRIELINCVNKFYGKPMDDDFNEKLLQRNEITADKINKIIVGELMPWSQLVQETRSVWPIVNDLASRQFPSYLLAIEGFESVSTEIVYTKRTLYLCISLLCKFYTVFYIDDYFFPKMKESSDDPDPRYQFYFKNLLPESKVKLDKEVDKVREICERHFMDYQYADHEWPMIHFVEGKILDQEEPETIQHPVFHYLFDNHLLRSDYQVLH